MHSIFQIRISRNTECADKTGFSRPGHIRIATHCACMIVHVGFYNDMYAVVRRKLEQFYYAHVRYRTSPFCRTMQCEDIIRR